MDVPQTRTEVTTSGFYREELDSLKETLSRFDLAYNGDLTSRTRVLVVHDACASKKFEVAREQNIPCVSSAWAFEGQCSLARIEEYDVRNTLCRYATNTENDAVCSTGIDSAQRAVLRDITTLRRLRFDSVLSRRSCLLIVPSLSTADTRAPRNDKVEFAKRHGIPIITMREFVLRYGQSEDIQHLLERRSQSRSLRSVPTFTAHMHLTRSSLDVTPSHNQLKVDMADVVLCVLPMTPDADLLAESRTLATLCGASWRETLTDETTHILVLARHVDVPVASGTASSPAPPVLTTSALFPRPGLETVHAGWLRACLRDQRRHACVNFRFRLAYKPVMIIAGVSVEKRDSFHYFLHQCGLLCELQDRLNLGDPSEHTCARRDDNTTPPPLTTHLIVPRPALLKSAEVEQLARERHCGSGASQCMLVDLEWLLRSIRARKWIEPTFFELIVPPPTVMEQERAKQRRTESSSGAVQPLRSPVAPAQAVDIVDAAADSRSGDRSMGEEDEEGASQTVPSQAISGGAPAPVSAHLPALLASPSTKLDDLPHSLTLEALLDALESHPIPFELPTSQTATQTVAASQVSVSERAPSMRPSPTPSHTTKIASVVSWQPRDAKRPRNPPTSPAEQCGYESQTVVYDHDNVSVAPRQFQPDTAAYVRPSITLTDLACLSTSAFPDFAESSKESPHSQEAPWVPSQSTGTRFVLLFSKEIAREIDCTRFQQQFPWVQCTQSVDECTHLITNKPAKTEVFLCALAAGKWIVSSAFLTDSMTRGKLVHEQNYEWNGKRATATGHRASVAELVQGCRMQRLATKRPFSAWHVFLTCSSAARTVSFAHVLKCGGCTEVHAKSPDDVLHAVLRTSTPDLSYETVVLADDDVWTLTHLEQFAAKSRSLKYHHVLRLDYLVHCLFSATPSAAQFELLHLLQTKKSSHKE